MKTKSKLSAYILRGSTTALLFSCVFVALCSAIHLPEQPPKAIPPQDNAAFAANAHQRRSLTFADRLAYQRVIEDVYWRHRIWPKQRLDPKPSLDAVMSQAQIEKKVEDYLRNLQALEDYWQRPITPDQLQAEINRMASHTRQPEVLREVFAALGNDPFIVAESLARPLLSERLVSELHAASNAPAAIEWLGSSVGRTKTESSVTTDQPASGYYLPQIATSSVEDPAGSCDDHWTATSITGAPDARSEHTAVWTGTEMIVWGGLNDSGDLNTGGRYVRCIGGLQDSSQQ